MPEHTTAWQECKVTDQKRTGRCWIFAALNVMRLGIMSKFNLADDFELVRGFKVQTAVRCLYDDCEQALK